MKVVIVSKALVRGTYQRVLEELVRLHDVELTVISPPSWKEGKSVLPLERRFTRGYELLVTPIVFNGRYHLHFYPRLAGLLRKLQPELVHVDEEPYNLATWLALRAARGCGARRLFYTWQNIYRTLPLPFAAIEQANYDLADGAIAANADAEAVLRRKGFKPPIWIIPPGVDPELYRPALPGSGDEFRVGYIGRLVPEKGVDLLLRACRSLAGAWRLAIVGEGEQRGALERLADELGERDRVSFSGSVASTEVADLLHDLDVVVLPSRSLPNWREQFGRILMEAMACEIPVVGSTCGEIPQVIGDAGLVFPEGDANALTTCLVTLQSDPELRRRLGQAGRARVLERFTHRNVAEHTLIVYRAILAGTN